MLQSQPTEKHRKGKRPRPWLLSLCLPQEPAPRSPGHSLVLDEGIFVDGFDDIFEKDLGGQSVAMVHDGLPVRPVPAVHCGQAEPG